MSDTTEFLMRMAEENWAQAGYTEDQRATLANLIVVIASIDQGVLNSIILERLLKAAHWSNSTHPNILYLTPQ